MIIRRTLNVLKKWPLWQKIWFFGILVGFWLSGAVFAYRHGNHANFSTDETTEQMSIFAANNYLDQGFFKNFLLPTYPPFGHAPDGKIRHEPFVYNHYLAGPDLVLGLWMKIFGRDALWSGRLIPHTLTVLAMASLTMEFAIFMGSTLMGCILLNLLMIPRSLTAWSIALYGHSYVMAFFLFLTAGILSIVNDKKKSTAGQAWFLGISIGLLQMFFDVDWLPLTFLFAASMVSLMYPRLSWPQGRRVLLGLVVGGSVALLYQLVISSLYYGSPTWVIENIFQWARFRAGVEHVEGVTMGDLRLSRVLQEYNQQAYGATGFTGLNLVALSVAFLLMGYWGRVKSQADAIRTFIAIALAYLGAVIWNVVMRQHSVAHTHFLPRHYFILYMSFMMVALPISYELVLRSRKARPA